MLSNFFHYPYAQCSSLHRRVLGQEPPCDDETIASLPFPKPGEVLPVTKTLPKQQLWRRWSSSYFVAHALSKETHTRPLLSEYNSKMAFNSIFLRLQWVHISENWVLVWNLGLRSHGGREVPCSRTRPQVQLNDPKIESITSSVPSPARPSTPQEGSRIVSPANILLSCLFAKVNTG